MTATYYIKDRPYTFSTKDRLAAGYEAEIFVVDVAGEQVAAKLFFTPDHPSLANQPPAIRNGARARIAELQTKLPAFPTSQLRHLNILCPKDLIYTRNRQVRGFTMALLPPGASARQYTDPEFREERGTTHSMVTNRLIELHEIVRQGHAAGIIFGDALSGNNVHFADDSVWILDANTIITPGHPNMVHSREFADPALCQADATHGMVMVKPHSTDSDLYAFTVLMAWLLMFVHPYDDGFYLPNEDMSGNQRALNGISTLHKDVELPPSAISPSHLPDELVEYLRGVFEKGERGVSPINLLRNLVWTTCSCGATHARDTCPSCKSVAPGSRTVRQGTVETTVLFAANSGEIVSTAAQNGITRYAYATDADLHRDSGLVLPNAFGADTRVFLCGDYTATLQANTLKIFQPDSAVALEANDVAGSISSVGSNSQGFYWLTTGGKIMWAACKDVVGAPQRIGVIAGSEPAMWMGEEFGVAFWRQMVTQGYVFDRERRGLTQVNLPAVPGDLKNAHCVLSSSLAWLFLAIERANTVYHHCYVIKDTGAVLAAADAPAGNGSWLGTDFRLHAATANRLFTPTPAGLVRVELEGGEIVEREPHTSSAPFLTGVSGLHVTNEGIITATGTELKQLVNR